MKKKVNPSELLSSVAKFKNFWASNKRELHEIKIGDMYWIRTHNDGMTVKDIWDEALANKLSTQFQIESIIFADVCHSIQDVPHVIASQRQLYI